MRKKSKLLITVGILIALSVGFLIGISVEYPKTNQNEVAGTITKIKNYRNSQNSKSDVQIQNDLVSDTVRLKSVKKTLNYYYLSAVKMANDVQFTLNAANSMEDFRKSHKEQIESLTNYDNYLSSARTDLLLAISVCEKPDGSDAQVFMELMNQAYNVIAQMSYKNRIVLEFIDNLSAFAKKNNSMLSEELMTAHDLLVLNEVNSALLTNDKTLLSSLDKKEFLSNVKNLKSYDNGKMSKLIIQDVESLGAVLDSETLGYWDSEKLGVFDQEKLGQALLFDSEKLNWFDSEKLSNWDSEKLGQFMYDSEYLGFFDAEQLGIYFE